MRLSGRDLRCIRGGSEVFSGLDFEVLAGQALAVTGPNGAGKTSLLRLIAGLLALAGGGGKIEAGKHLAPAPDTSDPASRQPHLPFHFQSMHCIRTRSSQRPNLRATSRKLPASVSRACGACRSRLRSQRPHPRS